MSTVLVNGEHPQGSVPTKRFGFGYEKKSANSASTLHAQAFFLDLLPRLRNDVTTTLFDIAYRPFVKFLDVHQAEILSIKCNIESAPFPTDTAMRIFIYGWSALRGQKTATQFCDALSEWANRWNLADEWCLNHALVTLREQHLSCLDNGMPHARFTKEAWQTALFFGSTTEAIFAQAEINEDFKHNKDFYEFTFKHEHMTFTVEGPFFRPIFEFRQEVEEKFKGAGGLTIRGLRKVLDYEQGKYLEKVAKAMKELGLEEPPVRRAAEEHLKWLIDFQLEPCKTYRQIAREVNKDEKTVREGIQRAASLIHLRLRSSEADKHLGRPKGAKDKNPRHRVDRRIQKLRGIPN